jgi:hypothetical protein
MTGAVPAPATYEAATSMLSGPTDTDVTYGTLAPDKVDVVYSTLS